MSKRFHSLQGAVQELFGNDRTITEKHRAHGGDINDAFALTLDDGTPLFMKANRIHGLSGFEAEAVGLQAIRETQAISTAQVLGIGTDPEGYAFLLLDYIEAGPKVPDYWETFAEQLAAMHHAQVKKKQFGFFSDNYIGSRVQINTWNHTWIDFYRSCRLETQFRAAERFFSASERKAFTWLLDHLDRFLTEPEGPSLVHGDLWSGNFMTGPDGKAWIIDPAVYYGHPEVDLAMTELFGGFPQTFYDAYQANTQMVPGYSERRDLYHLYQLLNHLNMFGASYLSSVKRVIKRYAG